MVADRLAHETQLPLLFNGADQAEVARAAADVDHQAARPRFEPGRLRCRVHGQPAVEGGLRLLQENQILQAGLAGAFHRQVPGHVVERSRHRQDD